MPQSPFESTLHEALRGGKWDLPMPARGATADRHCRLAAIAQEDLDVGRIAEAHTDALAILHEAQCRPRRGALYGVWASDGPQSQLRAERSGVGWHLHGTKQYCSGAPFVDAALVTAHSDEGVLLFDLAVNDGLQVQPSVWKNQGLMEAATAPVSFELDLAVEPVGGPDWYLTRIGFWHGAIGPAACWAGGALALIEAARSLNRRDPHSRAHLGALEALQWNLRAVLVQAGEEIDAQPGDKGTARKRALMARHLIERMCTEVMDRFGRATGPQLIAFDCKVAKIYAGLAVYIRQCHGERDLESLGG